MHPLAAHTLLFNLWFMTGYRNSYFKRNSSRGESVAEGGEAGLAMARQPH